MTVGETKMPARVSSGDRDAVLRQIRWCAAVQTLVNCHCELEENPVGNVKPMQLVVQYLTKTAIKLPSAGDNTRSSVQFVRYCPWCTGKDGVTVIHSRVNDSIDERSQRVKSPATAGYAVVENVGKSSPLITFLIFMGNI